MGPRRAVLSANASSSLLVRRRRRALTGQSRATTKVSIVYFLVICLFLESWGTGVFGLLLLSCCRREHFGTLLDTREVFEEIELRVAVFGDRIAEESLQLRLKAFLSVARKLF